MHDEISHRVALSLGSNIGPREEMILAALHTIGGVGGITLVRVSALYETEPVGDGFGGDFINAVCIVRAEIPARRLLEVCKGIERTFGRGGDEVSRDRPLDIDIVTYGDRVIHHPGLVIPHRAFRERLFVLDPLVEIAPELTVPPDGATVREIRAAVGPKERIRLVSKRSRID